MKEAKILNLYMTLPDMLRSGYRQRCESIEIDEGGIVGDVAHGTENGRKLLIVSQKSYDLIKEHDLVVDTGVLMEHIHVDEDLYDLKENDVLEIGDTVCKVLGKCEVYGYLAALAPELPEILYGNRGIFVEPVAPGEIKVGDKVIVHKA